MRTNSLLQIPHLNRGNGRMRAQLKMPRRCVNTYGATVNCKELDGMTDPIRSGESCDRLARIESDPDYGVAPSGRVYNIRTGRDLAPFPRGKSAHLSVDLPSGRRYVHQLVAENYIGPRPDGQEVRHLDNDAMNNTAVNLEYGTRSQNVLDLRKDRTHCPHGHEYTATNSYIDPNGWRSCRKCRQASRRRHRSNAHPQHQA